VDGTAARSDHRKGNSMSDQGPDPRAAYQHGYQDGQASRKTAKPGPGWAIGRVIWGIVRFVLGIILALIALRVGVAILAAIYHAWWMSTHCTMILGTQVCQG
jgi:hypothetical protein